MEVSRVYKLKDHVEYSSDAIVSKTLLDHRTGTLTLFAFARGQGLSEHSAPFDAVVQIVEGRGEINISGKTFTPSEGEAIIMPANIPHSVSAPEQFKMLLTMIRS